mgnify:CR=1 FL=1
MFDSIQGNSGLLNETLGDMGRDLEKFIGGKMDRAELMESLANKAEFYISNTIEKIAAGLTAEFGIFAPAVGKMVGYIAGKLFSEAVAPFINSAKRAKMARQKYEQLHEFFEGSIAQMEKQRQLFEKETSEFFARRQKLFDNNLKNFDEIKDINQKFVILGEIIKKFDGNPKIENFEEFENFLNSNEELSI